MLNSIIAAISLKLNQEFGSEMPVYTEDIEQYGYTPNSAARNLARNKTNAIGIVMPHCESDIY